MQCRNPASAHRCPTCHERYQLPTSPRAATAELEAGFEPQLVEEADWSRLELWKRRLIFRAGGATLMPPQEFGDSACKTAGFSLFNGAVWLLLALASTLVTWLMPLSHDVQVVQLVIFRTAIYGLVCALMSFVAARFKSWSVLKCYTFFSGLQIMLALTAVLMWSILYVLGWWSDIGKWKAVLICTHTFSFATAIATVVLMNDLNDELDPRRQRREYRRQRRQARNERRQRERQRHVQQAHLEPAVAASDGVVVDVGLAQSGISLRQFLASVHVEAHHDAITSMGVASVEQLLTLDEQACIAQGMLPLQVRRMKRVASEHLQQVERDRAIQGSVVGFTTANEPPSTRRATTGGGLSDGLLGQVV